MMKFSDMKYCAALLGCIFLTTSFAVLIQHAGIDPGALDVYLPFFPALVDYAGTPGGFFTAVFIPGIALSIIDLAFLKRAVFGGG
jgi:hypothetical protein